MNRALVSIDPARGELVRTWAELGDGQLEERLAGAHAAARTWGAGPSAARAEVLERAAALFRARSEALALGMAEEMGKPLAQGRAEVEKCALGCEFYARHGAAWLADERPEQLPPRTSAGRNEHARGGRSPRPAQPDPTGNPPGDRRPGKPVVDRTRLLGLRVPTRAESGGAGAREQVVFRPLGLVLAIMPWNFPLWQVVRAAAPALLAGNGVLLKHAENVQGCATALEELFLAAGAPQGVLVNLPVAVARVPALIRDRRVAAVTLTGSTRAGRAVAALAGAALKKCVLELGGSDPYVVLADADLALAARACVAARLVNGGQSCIAAKRFVVVEPARAEFTERVVAEMRAKTMGDPRGAVDLGPLARADLREALHDQVRASVARGARCLLGGELPDGPGFFYPPTVLDGVAPGQPAYAQELFGPAAAILAARDEAHALALANDTPFGLGAAVFTRDVERGLRLAREALDAGSVFVNDFVRSDPRLPFGGIKDSGYGRELGAFGLREFVNVKTIAAPGGAR